MTIAIPHHIVLGLRLNNIWLGILVLLMLVAAGSAAYTGELLCLLAPWIVLMIKIVYEDVRVLFWLFILSVPLSAEVHFANGLSVSLPDEPLMLGLLALMMCIIIYNYKILPSWLWRSPVILIIVLQYVWTAVTVLYAEDLFLATKFLLAKTWYLASFVFFSSLFIKSGKDIKWLFIIFATPIILHSMFAFTSHAFQGFGYWESNVVVRPFYSNHVDYGSVLSMIFPAIFIAILMRKRFDTRKLILIGVLIFLAAAIFVAFSRAAILAAVFSVVVFFAVKKKLAHYIMPAVITFIASIIIILSQNNKYLDFRPNMSKNATQETFLETVVGSFTGTDMSSMERFYRWIASVRMSSENPVLGVGPNNWYYHYKPHAVNAFKTWVSRNEERSTTHNYFLLMLTEQGWPAMILYTILMIVILSTGQKTYHRFTDPTYKYYTIAVLMIIGASFVNNFFSELLETHKVGGIFFLSVLILAFLRQKSLEQEKDSSAIGQ